MTAEEKLQELKETLDNGPPTGMPKYYPVRLSPKDIDVIVNLVVERLSLKSDKS